MTFSITETTKRIDKDVVLEGYEVSSFGFTQQFSFNAAMFYEQVIAFDRQGDVFIVQGVDAMSWLFRCYAYSEAHPTATLSMCFNETIDKELWYRCQPNFEVPVFSHFGTAPKVDFILSYVAAKTATGRWVRHAAVVHGRIDPKPIVDAVLGYYIQEGYDEADSWAEVVKLGERIKALPPALGQIVVYYSSYDNLWFMVDTIGAGVQTYLTASGKLHDYSAQFSWRGLQVSVNGPVNFQSYPNYLSKTYDPVYIPQVYPGTFPWYAVGASQSYSYHKPYASETIELLKSRAAIRSPREDLAPAVGGQYKLPDYYQQYFAGNPSWSSTKGTLFTKVAWADPEQRLDPAFREQVGGTISWPWPRPMSDQFGRLLSWAVGNGSLADEDRTALLGSVDVKQLFGFKMLYDSDQRAETVKEILNGQDAEKRRVELQRMRDSLASLKASGTNFEKLPSAASPLSPVFIGYVLGECLGDYETFRVSDVQKLVGWIPTNNMDQDAALKVFLEKLGLPTTDGSFVLKVPQL